MSTVGVRSGDEALAELLRARRGRKARLSPAVAPGKKRSPKPVSPKEAAGQQLDGILRFVGYRYDPEIDGSPLVIGEYLTRFEEECTLKAGCLAMQGQSLARELKWRAISDEAFFRYATLGVCTSTSFSHFTVMVHPDLTEWAIWHSPKGFMDRMRQRIRHELAREFGRAVPLIFVAEFEGGVDKSPHVHGTVGVDFSDRDRLRRALRRAAGSQHDEWFADNRAVDIKRPYKLFGWANYCLGGQDETRRFIVKRSLISCSHEVTRKAKQLYLLNCGQIIAARLLCGSVAPLTGRSS